MIVTPRCADNVPPEFRVMCKSRAKTNKSDPIDALAAAQAALREPNLPTASHDEISRELKLLVDRRDDLVAFRTATANRLIWRIHELAPGRDPGSLNVAKNVAVNPPTPAAKIMGETEVSRSWLYSQPDLRAEIERLRARPTPAPAGPRIPERQPASVASLRRRLEVVSERNRHLARIFREMARETGCR